MDIAHPSIRKQFFLTPEKREEIYRLRKRKGNSVYGFLSEIS
jgi:hypothetical protein